MLAPDWVLVMKAQTEPTQDQDLTEGRQYGTIWSSPHTGVKREEASVTTRMSKARVDGRAETGEGTMAHITAAAANTPAPAPSVPQMDATGLPVGVLLGPLIPAVSLNLMEVYGDYIHKNNRTHLDGGISDGRK